MGKESHKKYNIIHMELASDIMIQIIQYHSNMDKFELVIVQGDDATKLLDIDKKRVFIELNKLT